MTVHVQLDILPGRVDPAAWAEVFDETLAILQRWREPLMRADQREHFGERVPVYVPDIAFSEDGVACWAICGDLGTLRAAEQLTLCRSYPWLERPSRGDPGDIVCLDAEDPRPTRVFAARTQGAPYHLAALAAAMIIEARFSPYAAVSGVISRAQAIRALEALPAGIHRVRPLAARSACEIQLPVCVDPPRLIARLSRSFGGDALIDAFAERYLDRDTPVAEVALGAFPRIQAEPWWMRCLHRYESAEEHGVVELFASWLNVTGDLDALFVLACKDGAGPRFPAEDVVRAVAALGVALPRETVEARPRHVRPKGASDSLWTLMGQFLLGLEERRVELRARFDRGALEDVLRRHFGARSRSLIHLLHSESSRVREELATARSVIDEHFEPASEAPEPALAALDTGGLPRAERDELLDLAFATHRARAALAAQEAVDPRLRAMLEDPGRLLAGILARHGPRLTERAWRTLEREQDPATWRLLIALTMLGDDPEVAELRRAALESEAVRRFVAAASADDALMSEVEARWTRAPA